MIICVENLMNLQKKLPELISKCGEVAGFKISIQKFVVFLHACSESSEIEILKSTIQDSVKKYRILRNKCDKSL